MNLIHIGMKKLLLSTLLVFIVLSMNNCKNNDDPYVDFPYTVVNYTINLNLPSYSELGRPGGYVVIDNEGYKGIIVYHTPDDKYIAYDRTCTYQPMSECAKVYVDDSGLYTHCGEEEADCCSSKYDMDGLVINGPAKYPLRRYNVSRNSNTLIILN